LQKLITLLTFVLNKKPFGLFSPTLRLRSVWQLELTNQRVTKN